MIRNLPSAKPSSRPFAVLALAFLAVLGGCAGSGGGPAGIPPPFGSGYPTLANATSADTGPGISATYTSATANEFVSVPSFVAVEANVPGPGQIKISVRGVPVPGGTEPDFFFVVNTAALTDLANSPLTGGTLSPACASCLRRGTVIAEDGQTVTFLYLSPAAAGFSYSTLGLWSKPSDVSALQIGGAFSLGVVTRGSDLPSSGTANYAGFLVGRYATSDTDVGAPTPGIYAVGANASAQVTFGPAGRVSFRTLNTQIRPEGVGGALGAAQTATHLDLNAPPMPISGDATTNAFSGPVITTGGLAGSLGGAFYGRPDTATSVPPEMGGVVSVNKSVVGGTQTMVGGFALKVQ